MYNEAVTATNQLIRQIPYVLIAERRWALWRLPVGVLAITCSIGLFVAVFGPPIGVESPVISLL